MNKFTFPKGFLWGTSTAAHQVEGNNINSDWWSWEQEKVDRVKSGISCDHYHLYKSDFALAKKLGHSAHRLSIEWARIEPKEGEFSKKEVEHYRNVIKELRKLNLKSFVTLWHFTLPKWFADLGGFEKKSNFKFFEEYVKLCAKEFGGLVDFWITLNEPNNYVFNGYLLGTRPPQKRNLLTALRVYRNICDIHNLTYKTIKSVNNNYLVGAAHQLISCSSEGGLLNDFITKIFNHYVNDFFHFNTRLYHDFIGLNYYFKDKLSYKYLLKKVTRNDDLKILEGQGKSLGWSMDASGIYDCIKYINKKFQDKPIYILEHGISDATDKIREEHLKTGLSYVLKAISEGADVKGYLHWSLMDNYEWDYGFVPKFGLCETDFKTQKRIPRKSAYLFREISVSNKI